MRTNPCKPPKCWHPQEEAVLKEWGELCNSYAWMHSRAAERMSRFSSCLFVPSVVLNGVIASVSFAMHSDASVVIGILNVVAGGLMVLERSLELGSSRDKHRECAMLFSKVGRSIASELVLPHQDRMMDGREFLRFAGFEADRILQMNVALPDAIVNKFQKTFGSDPTTLHEIKIYPHSSPEDSESSSTTSTSTTNNTDSEEEQHELRRSVDNLKFHMFSRCNSN